VTFVAGACPDAVSELTSVFKAFGARVLQVYQENKHVHLCQSGDAAAVSSDEALGLSWFALQVRSRQEDAVGAFLGVNGHECFLPTYRCRRQWSDRVKEGELPLFPGYLFCRFDLRNRVSVLKTPGLISIVGIGRIPIPIDDTEIAALRCLMSSGIQTQPWPYVAIGQRVKINHGALSGLEGILQSFKGHHRVVVSVTLLQRSVAAEVDSAWLSPSRPHPPSSEGPLSGDYRARAMKTSDQIFR
jgi:transcription antitermination factor NusG